MSIPATQAVIKQAIDPVTIARNANSARSDARAGANVLNEPTWIPMELRFAKPHKANVAIVCERFYDEMNGEKQNKNMTINGEKEKKV